MNERRRGGLGKETEKSQANRCDRDRRRGQIIDSFVACWKRTRQGFQTNAAEASLSLAWPVVARATPRRLNGRERLLTATGVLHDTFVLLAASVFI